MSDTSFVGKPAVAPLLLLSFKVISYYYYILKVRIFLFFILLIKRQRISGKIPELHYFKLFKKKPKTLAREKISLNKSVDHVTISVAYL